MLVSVIMYLAQESHRGSTGINLFLKIKFSRFFLNRLQPIRWGASKEPRQTYKT